MLAKLYERGDMSDGDRRREIDVQWGKPDPWDLWRHKDNQHKAQISSTLLLLSYCTVV